MTLKVIIDAAALLLSCPTLCDPIDGSPPDFPSLGCSRQELWSGLPFPSPVRESEVAQSYPTVSTPWTAAYQAPPSMGFFRQKYWSGVPLPPLIDRYVFIAILNCIFLLILYFFVPFFFSCCALIFFFFCIIRMFFLVFVNLFYVFDCGYSVFSSMSTPSLCISLRLVVI